MWKQILHSIKNVFSIEAAACDETESDKLMKSLDDAHRSRMDMLDKLDNRIRSADALLVSAGNGCIKLRARNHG